MARDIKSVIHQIHDTGYEAVIFPSNTITVSGVTAINELGYSIPDDIAVVGFDQGDSSGIFNTNMLFVDYCRVFLPYAACRNQQQRQTGNENCRPSLFSPVKR